MGRHAMRKRGGAAKQPAADGGAHDPPDSGGICTRLVAVNPPQLRLISVLLSPSDMP